VRLSVRNTNGIFRTSKTLITGLAIKPSDGLFRPLYEGLMLEMSAFSIFKLSNLLRWYGWHHISCFTSSQRSTTVSFKTIHLYLETILGEKTYNYKGFWSSGHQRKGMKKSAIIIIIIIIIFWQLRKTYDLEHADKCCKHSRCLKMRRWNIFGRWRFNHISSRSSPDEI